MSRCQCDVGRQRRCLPRHVSSLTSSKVGLGRLICRLVGNFMTAAGRGSDSWLTFHHPSASLSP